MLLGSLVFTERKFIDIKIYYKCIYWVKNKAYHLNEEFASLMSLKRVFTLGN